MSICDHGYAGGCCEVCDRPEPHQVSAPVTEAQVARCPFCRSANFRRPMQDLWRKWIIGCADCGAEGPQADSEAEAIAAWNTRATETAATNATLERAAPWTPPEPAWSGLPRQLVMWLDMGDKTPRALFKHLDRCGYEIPQWLRDEPEMRHLDHVPSKGTRAVLIYRAVLHELRSLKETDNG